MSLFEQPPIKLLSFRTMAMTKTKTKMKFLLLTQMELNELNLKEMI